MSALSKLSYETSQDLHYILYVVSHQEDKLIRVKHQTKYFLTVEFLFTTVIGTSRTEKTKLN